MLDAERRAEQTLKQVPADRRIPGPKRAVAGIVTGAPANRLAVRRKAAAGSTGKSGVEVGSEEELEPRVLPG